MNVTYDNLSPSCEIVTFTEIPNILKLSEVVGGAKANLVLSMNSGLISTVSADSQYFITFLGETIYNVMDIDKAKNKRFYISSDVDYTAMSIAKAFRNCGGIAADFNITGDYEDVHLAAKTIGSKWGNNPNYLIKNIPSTYMGVSASDGNAYSTFFNSLIIVDIYSGETVNEDNYITTLEKNWYGNECAFDVSPVLATFSEYGKTIPYTMNIKVMTENGVCNDVDTVHSHSAIGYHANQSDKYKLAQGVQLLINKNRGSDGVMTLYTYENYIPYSVLCGLDQSAWNVDVSVKDSTFTEIYSAITTNSRQSSNMLIDGGITIPQSAMTNGYYVDLTIANETVRFNIIKPLKATEYNQRVLWRNEYGGISFFDFTSTKSEADSVEISTYEKNVFDYYETEHFERKKIYDNDYNKNVSLTTHLMEEDGKWIFNSLMMSKKVWTTVNGKMYYIIPKAIEVTEDQTYNNIYTAKLTYEYSDI